MIKRYRQFAFSTAKNIALPEIARLFHSASRSLHARFCKFSAVKERAQNNSRNWRFKLVQD